ncbi:uncharacterized protein LOC144115669 [Amblyomma americanum]
MAGSNDEVLATVNVVILACSLLLHRRRARNARKRRFWVRPMFRRREQEGQARLLLPRLRAEDEAYFRDYLRMPPSTFDTLLGFVEHSLSRQVTPFRDPISAHDRLAITLRFLANGDTFRSLSYNFLIGRSTASVLIRETTAAIWKNLWHTYVPFPQTEIEWRKIHICRSLPLWW